MFSSALVLPFDAFPKAVDLALASTSDTRARFSLLSLPGALYYFATGLRASRLVVAFSKTSITPLYSKPRLSIAANDGTHAVVIDPNRHLDLDLSSGN